jgi:hypothetical protein
MVYNILKLKASFFFFNQINFWLGTTTREESVWTRMDFLSFFNPQPNSEQKKAKKSYGLGTI